MKKIIPILMLSFVLVFNLDASAQDDGSIDIYKKNYIVLVNKLSEIKPVCLASDQMRLEDGEDFGEFQIVFIGKNIEELVDKRAITKHLERLKLADVKFIACGYSLEKYDVNPEKLPEGIEIIDNGVTYSLKLKKKGFYGMEL